MHRHFYPTHMPGVGGCPPSCPLQLLRLLLSITAAKKGQMLEWKSNLFRMPSWVWLISICFFID
jgi:hypothetical protein